jgi:hypothetical protein
MLPERLHVGRHSLVFGTILLALCDNGDDIRDLSSPQAHDRIAYGGDRPQTAEESGIRYAQYMTGDGLILDDHLCHLGNTIILLRKDIHELERHMMEHG